MTIKRKTLNSYDKESVLVHLKSLAEQLGQDTISIADLKEHGEVSVGTLYKKFGGFSKLLIEAGMTPGRIYNRDKKDMIESLGSLMNNLQREPTQAEISRHLPYNARHFINDFGSMKNAFDLAQECVNTLGASLKKINLNIKEKKDRRRYGELIQFRGMQHAPVNELGVVFLFGMIAHELNFRVESVQAGFPDCDAKYKRPDGTFERVAIEFEFKSSSFQQHNHDPEKCDLIVCWENDWKNCPLEVIELSTILKELQYQEAA
jgi:hypothetical protein